MKKERYQIQTLVTSKLSQPVTTKRSIIYDATILGRAAKNLTPGVTSNVRPQLTMV